MVAQWQRIYLWCRRCRRCRFNCWVRKIPWRRAWQPIPIFLPGGSHGQRSLAATVHRVTKSQTWLKWLRTSMHGVTDGLPLVFQIFDDVSFSGTATGWLQWMICFFYIGKRRELENNAAKPLFPGRVLIIVKATKFPREVLEYAMLFLSLPKGTK